MCDGILHQLDLREWKKNLTWICDVCGDERHDEFISVHTRDISEIWGLPKGIMKENIKFCNDREVCREGAKRYSNLGKRGEVNAVRRRKRRRLGA